MPKEEPENAAKVAELRDEQGMAWKAIGEKLGFSASKARTLYRQATGQSHTKSKGSKKRRTVSDDGRPLKDMTPHERRKVKKEAETARRRVLRDEKPFFTEKPEEEELWEVLQPGRTIEVRTGKDILANPYIEEYKIGTVRRVARYKPDGPLCVEYNDDHGKYRCHAASDIMEVR